MYLYIYLKISQPLAFLLQNANVYCWANVSGVFKLRLDITLLTP